MTTYYFDASGGSDANDGLSEGSPKRTIAHLMTLSLGAGDSALFKRDETWYEALTIQAGWAGTAGNKLTFGAYGSGAEPRIWGAEVSHTFIQHSGNIWRRENVTWWEANSGGGGTWFSFFWGWLNSDDTYGKSTVQSLSTASLGETGHVPGGNEHGPDIGSLAEALSTLTKHGDWYLDPAANIFYMYWNPAGAGLVLDANPNNEVVYLPRRSCVDAQTGQDYLRFENLDLRWSIAYGLWADSAGTAFVGWEVIGCKVGYCCRDGMRFEGMENPLISGNDVRECGIDRSESNGGTGTGSSAKNRSSGIVFASAGLNNGTIINNFSFHCGEKNLLSLESGGGITGTVECTGNVSILPGEFHTNIKSASAAGGTLRYHDNILIDAKEATFSGGSQGSGRLTVEFENNLCANPGGHQIQREFRPRSGERHRIVNNLFIGYDALNSTADHRDEGIEIADLAENVFIAHNTFLADRDNGEGLVYLHFTGVAEVVNNLFVNRGAADCMRADSVGVNLTLNERNNVFDGAAANPWTGFTPDATSNQDTVTFIDEQLDETADLRLDPASVAGVGDGATDAGIATDFLGNPFGSPPNRGAYAASSLGQNIAGALFTDPDTFPAGQLDMSLAGALFTDPDTFPAGAVGLGVAGALFVDPDTFPGGVVAREGDSPLAGGGWYAATRRRRRS